MEMDEGGKPWEHVRYSWQQGRHPKASSGPKNVGSKPINRALYK